MWHVSSRSGVATLRTAIHLLLTYLLTYIHTHARARTVRTAIIVIIIDYVCIEQGGYILYAGASLAGVSCRRRWPRLLLLSLER